eukprot:896049-Prorocentrum_minimum.AAC.1
MPDAFVQHMRPSCYAPPPSPANPSPIPPGLCSAAPRPAPGSTGLLLVCGSTGLRVCGDRHWTRPALDRLVDLRRLVKWTPSKPATGLRVYGSAGLRV